MLSILNYSQLWLDSGILTESILNAQIEEMKSGVDDHTEHYRYRTISSYFKEQTYFDNYILENVLKLIESEVDESMASSITILLLKNNALTDEQFDKVAAFLKTFGDWTTKHIEKVKNDRIKKHKSST